jgi:hypothetical protein
MQARRLFKSILAEYPRRNSADRRHLGDWAQDPRAEEIWQRLNRRKEADAKDFIGRVLTARRNAGALMARLTQSKRQREEWHKYYAQRTSDIFARNHSIADIGDELLALAYAMQDAAHVFDAWDSQMLPRVLPEAATNRQDANNWRVKKLCALELSRFWRMQCGTRGDAEVAALIEIAFPGTEIDAEQVRNARRPTKKTKRVRATPAGELKRPAAGRVHH